MGEIVGCYPWEMEPVTRTGLVNSVRLSKPKQGISALKNSIALRYHFGVHYTPYDAKGTKCMELHMRVI